MNIQFEGKIKMKNLIDTLMLLKLLQFLTQEKGFIIAKVKNDEIKLTKTILPAADSERSSDGDAVELEVEIEVECAKLEHIKDIVSEIAALIDS